MEKRKNIHLLPTDKGQRITKTSKGTLLWCSKSAEDFIEIRKGYLGFHLYITNDEEIKEGDWCYDVALKVFQASHNFNGYNNNLCKKIILTTDQDLIKDNVQAIDNEFLDWFVKNPSCEEVEVVKGFADGTNYGYNFLDYKIIIPKEEPKAQGYICPQTKNQCDDECCVSAEDCHIKASIGVLEEPKQETLEEAAEKYVNSFEFGIAHPRRVCKNAFINGAKWQQERMYSEEDLRYAFECATDLNPSFETFSAWFKQFKKKQQ